MTLRKSFASQADLRGIFDYILLESSAERARNMIVRIEDLTELLADQPGIGALKPELETAGRPVRAITQPPYVIYYTVNEDEVFVLRVLHRARGDVAERLQEARDE